MTTIEEIERAISGLPEDELARLRAWFDEFDADLFDRKIEGDAQSGRLDRLADQAIADLGKGRARRI
jgi:hypothetical protein